MSQELRQALYCPECKNKDPLLKISGVEVGCEVEIKCPKCENNTRIRFRLTQDGWERSRIYD